MTFVIIVMLVFATAMLTLVTVCTLICWEVKRNPTQKKSVGTKCSRMVTMKEASQESSNLTGTSDSALQGGWFVPTAFHNASEEESALSVVSDEIVANVVNSSPEPEDKTGVNSSDTANANKEQNLFIVLDNVFDNSQTADAIDTIGRDHFRQSKSNKPVDVVAFDSDSFKNNNKTSFLFRLFRRQDDKHAVRGSLKQKVTNRNNRSNSADDEITTNGTTLTAVAEETPEKLSTEWSSPACGQSWQKTTFSVAPVPATAHEVSKEPRENAFEQKESILDTVALPSELFHSLQSEDEDAHENKASSSGTGRGQAGAKTSRKAHGSASKREHKTYQTKARTAKLQRPKEDSTSVVDVNAQLQKQTCDQVSVDLLLLFLPSWTQTKACMKDSCSVLPFML